MLKGGTASAVAAPRFDEWLRPSPPSKYSAWWRCALDRNSGMARAQVDPGRPSGAPRSAPSQLTSQRQSYEAGINCPGAYCSGLPALECRGSHKAHRQRDLHVVISPSYRSTKSCKKKGTSRNCRSPRWRNSCATSTDTSCDQPSAVLKPTSRSGFLY